MAKRLAGILPGEQVKGKSPKGRRPKPGKWNGYPGEPGSIDGQKPKPIGGPISNDPAPTSYGQLKKAFNKPGIQPGEKEAISRIAANRGVDRKGARKIALNRTSKGLSIKGSAGPNGLGKGEPKGRIDMPVIGMGPRDKVRPTPAPVEGGPKPKLPTGAMKPVSSGGSITSGPIPKKLRAK